MEGLGSWVQRHGGGLHQAVEAAEDVDSGWGFRVKGGSHFQSGETAVACPVEVTLSFINVLGGFPSGASQSHADTPASSLMKQFPQDSHPFPPSFLTAVPPHVVARFLLIKQFLLGPSSFWHPYISTLPQPSQLAAWALPPAGWAKDDVELLDDTNVGNAVEEVKARLKSEYKHATAVLQVAEDGDENEGQGPASHEYTRILYSWAYSIFTSRSFRPSRVVRPQDFPLLKQALPEGVDVDDFAVLMPLFDLGNHSPMAEVEWAFGLVDGKPQGEDELADGSASLGEEAEEAVSSYSAFNRTVVELKASISGGFHAGQHIFNNYGDKTNAELLMAYGFLVPETEFLHNDYVHLRLRTAGQAGPGTGTANNEDNKPREFLFSLRPVTDPASVTAQKRLLISDLRTEEVIPPFRLVEDSLVWELVALQTTPEQREMLLPLPEETVSRLRSSEGRGIQDQYGNISLDGNANVNASVSSLDRERLRVILTGKTGAEFRPMLEQIMAIIQAKAMLELEKLEQSDFEMDEGFEATNVQFLAYSYRVQCRKVLVGVLESLGLPEEE